MSDLDSLRHKQQRFDKNYCYDDEQVWKRMMVMNKSLVKVHKILDEGAAKLQSRHVKSIEREREKVNNNKKKQESNQLGTRGFAKKKKKKDFLFLEEICVFFLSRGGPRLIQPMQLE